MSTWSLMGEEEKHEQAERADALSDALRTISRMTLMPDDKINRITLSAAIQIARDTLDRTL